MVINIESMNNKLKTFAICVALTTCSIDSFAQAQVKGIKKAVNVVKGLSSDYDKPQAVSMIRRAAEVDSMGYAMNALGMVYLHGIEMACDTTQAAYWFEQAGRHGYKNAYHNLAMLYKSKEQQDFVRSFEAYRRGAEGGSVMCYYGLGFMLYKGLGCQQNYEQAAEWFGKGADKDHSPCLYMLGLCYRNGYGVEQDEQRANYYLRRASLLGYTAATEELERELPENHFDGVQLASDLQQDIPESMPDIEPFILQPSDLAGEYQGFLVTYDWSGQHVIKEQPLALTARVSNDKLSGQWIEGLDTVTVRAQVTNEGKLLFEKSGISRVDRYQGKAPVRYRFDDADVSVEDGIITGRLRLYSTLEREPERPMYIVLQKKNSQNTIGSSGRIYAYPNPFAEQLTASFTLKDDVDGGRAYIYTQNGILAKSYSFGHLEAGRHAFTLSPHLSDGIYILQIIAGQQQYRTIIIKKQGAQ